jgi:hypothetical protein
VITKIHKKTSENNKTTTFKSIQKYQIEKKKNQKTEKYKNNKNKKHNQIITK